MNWEKRDGQRVKLGFTHGCTRRFFTGTTYSARRAGRQSGHTLLNTHTQLKQSKLDALQLRPMVQTVAIVTTLADRSRPTPSSRRIPEQ